MKKKHVLDALVDRMKRRIREKKVTEKRPRGSEVRSSKLNETEVKAIRLGYKLGYSCDELAKIYTTHVRLRTGKPEERVTRQAVWRIVSRKDWKHIPEMELPQDLIGVGPEVLSENKSPEAVTFDT